MLGTPDERIDYAFQRISDALGFVENCGEGGATLELHERTIVYANPGYGRIVIRPEDKYASVYGSPGAEHFNVIDAAMDGCLLKWISSYEDVLSVAAMNASIDEFPPILI